MSCQATLAEKIVKALAVFGSHTPSDVEEAISLGLMQHWESGETVVVTEVKDYPQFRSCEVFMVAGDLDTAWDIEDRQIIPWAKDRGCTRMVGKGRKGWFRSARNHGYGVELVTAVKEI